MRPRARANYERSFLHRHSPRGAKSVWNQIDLLDGNGERWMLRGRGKLVALAFRLLLKVFEKRRRVAYG
jgi:hypothetical protein